MYEPILEWGVWTSGGNLLAAFVWEGQARAFAELINGGKKGQPESAYVTVRQDQMLVDFLSRGKV